VGALAISLVWSLGAGSAVSAVGSASGSWKSVAGLDRNYHTATLLPDGRILVAGGCLKFDFLNGVCLEATRSAVLFDPLSGRTSKPSKMTMPRAGATATPLPNGKILVAGGDLLHKFDLVTWTFTAELFDPTTNKWSPAGSANPYPLKEGKPDFPTTAFGGSFGATKWGPMAKSLYSTLFGHTVTQLPAGPASICKPNCGKLLLVGHSRADLYDPATGRWRLLVQSKGITIRYFHTATLLKGGKVLIAGFSLNSTELFDPKTATFAPASSELIPRASATATLLPGGKVLSVGGFKGGDLRRVAPSAEFFDPKGNDPFNPKSLGAWKPARALAIGRFGHESVRLKSGKILVVGGSESPKGRLTDAELFDPRTESWSAAASMSQGRWGGAFGLLNSAFPAASSARAFTATLLDDGRVVVIGGGSKIAEIYTPEGGALASGRESANRRLLAPALGALVLLLACMAILAWRRNLADRT